MKFKTSTWSTVATAVLLFFCANLAFSQADSVNSRLERITLIPAPTGLVALTQGPRLDGTAGHVGMPNHFCSRPYINRTGVVVGVMLYGPVYGDTTLYVVQNPAQSMVWTASARVNNSTSSQGFVAPGGLFCVLTDTRDGIGRFEVTVFKANAQPSEYPQIQLWIDQAMGTCTQTVIQVGQDETVMSSVERPVIRRVYIAAGGQRPDEYYFDGPNGRTQAAVNPAGNACPT